jgi:hypothetical protein
VTRATSWKGLSVLGLLLVWECLWALSIPFVVLSIPLLPGTYQVPLWATTVWALSGITLVPLAVLALAVLGRRSN